jgi:hypothetical protein
MNADHCTVARHYHGTYVRYRDAAGRMLAAIRTCPWRDAPTRAEVLVAGRIIGYAPTLAEAARRVDAALVAPAGRTDDDTARAAAQAIRATLFTPATEGGAT